MKAVESVVDTVLGLVDEGVSLSVAVGLLVSGRDRAVVETLCRERLESGDTEVVEVFDSSEDFGFGVYSI